MHRQPMRGVRGVGRFHVQWCRVALSVLLLAPGAEAGLVIGNPEQRRHTEAVAHAISEDSVDLGMISF